MPENAPRNLYKALRMQAFQTYRIGARALVNGNTLTAGNETNDVITGNWCAAPRKFYPYVISVHPINAHALSLSAEFRG